MKARAPPRKTRSVLPEDEDGAYLLSTDGGRTCVKQSPAQVEQSAGAGAGVADFTAKRIRSGVETALASMRVSKEDRGHLLSHGVGGVQANSYDGHDYMAANLSDLQALHGSIW